MTHTVWPSTDAMQVKIVIDANGGVLAGVYEVTLMLREAAGTMSGPYIVALALSD